MEQMKQPDASIQVVDKPTISRLALEAEHSPRKRSHLLLHSGPNDQVQRLLIVLQPGSYIRPHHHSEQWEILILLRGRGQLLQFGGNAELLCRSEMSVAAPVGQIPTGAWHGFVVLERDTAVMEIKPGPYRPNEFAQWAAPEGDAGVPRFLDWIASARVGDSWSISG
jgi:cupin fold WbuC family metalloprotein